MSLLNTIASLRGVHSASQESVKQASADLGRRSLHRQVIANAIANGRSADYSGYRFDSVAINGGYQRYLDKNKDNKGAKLTVVDFAARQLLAAEHNAARSQVVQRASAMRRMDSTVPMASQALASIYQIVYNIEHADLNAWDGNILPIDTKMADPAAENFVWYERDLAGMPQAASTYDLTKIPMVVGPVAAQNQGFIVPALVGFETNFMEPRRAALSRQNNKPDFQIEAGMIETANRVIAEFYNSLWLNGDSTHQIDGLHTSPVVPVYTAVGAWSGLTDIQLIAELNRLWNLIPNNTLGRLNEMKRIRMLCPPSQYDRLTKPSFTASGLPTFSVWKLFADSKGIPLDNLVKVHEFAATNSQIYTGGPLGLVVDTAYFVYEKGDGWDCSFILSQPIEIPSPPRLTGLGEVTYMHARGGGVMIQDAQRIFRYTGL
jgi:hypothetical protein